MDDTVEDELQIGKDRQEEWEKSVKTTDNDIIDMFPESGEVISQKLNEYWEESVILYKEVKEIRRVVERIQTDTFSRWFYYNAEKFPKAKRLKWLHEQIKRLERMNAIHEKKRVGKMLSQEFFKTVKERERFDIDKMFERQELLLDMVAMDGIKLRVTGGGGMGLCPFHQEKTPSFYVYKSNWAHCFGCQWHGNFIDYVMKRDGCTFREALEESNRYV